MGPGGDPTDPYNLDPDQANTVELDDPALAGSTGDVVHHDDGSATVVMDDESSEGVDFSSAPFDANLADYLDKDDLTEVSNELVELFEADSNGRKEWEDAYVEGMDYLGLKVEDRSKPWPGAAGVYHPLLMEAVVRFQSQAMGEIFPPAGPAKTRILGKESADKNKLAQRVQEELNYQLTCRMPDYRGETERMLFRLALVGSVFRKVYFDPIRRRMCAKFIPAEDFVVPYGETDLSTAERFTHVCRMSGNELKRMTVAGIYRDIDLPDPTEVSGDDVADKQGEITGVKAMSPGSERHTLLEFHCDWDFGEAEYALPYIVTLHKDSGEVLAIRRNWKEDDEAKERRSYFVAYEYVPGLGFYGFGLIHLIGGITKSVTGILRQLIDAGTLSNLPGGLKSRGLRIKGDDTPIRPGEFRDVDVASGKIAEAITFLPYKEPSAVLMNLLSMLSEEGRRVGSIAEIDVGDMNAEAPVGTTLALLERAQKVMNAVQSRLHASLEKELKLIAEGIGQYMDPKYDFDVGYEANRQQDFQAAAFEVIPVSDPGATTMSQRVVQHQAALQMASQAPQVYDIPKLHRQGLEILGVKDAEELVPLPEEEKPQDPITENMNILKGSPVKSFIFQDHQAHIAVHMSAMQDPQIQQMVGQSPNAPMIMSAAQAHIAEHVAYAYRQQMEQLMGTQLPAEGQELNPQQEAQLARLAIPAAQKLLGQHQQEAAQQQAQQMAQDPLVQLQARELAVKEADQVRKAATDQAKIVLDGQKAQLKAKVELARIDSSKEIAAAQMGVDMMEGQKDREAEAERSADQIAAQAKAQSQRNGPVQ
jgi:hypothetical protein